MFKYKKILYFLSLTIFLGSLFFYTSCNLCKNKEESLVVKSEVKFVMNPEKIKKVVLNNGMTVLVFKNEASPRVLMQIAYDVGSYVEKSGEKGLAHLIEHMIFKGTEKLSETDISAIARKYGADHNAFTSKDITSYYFETNKNNWKPFMSILADCMQNARFDGQHLASEMVTVLQELKMYKDQYWRVMIEKASELIFPANHPYHFPVIGFKQDVANLNAENLKKFYKKYYTPERTYLFIVGDVDIDSVIEEAKNNFENIKVSKDSQKEFLVIPKITKHFIKYNTTFYEDVKKEQLGFYWYIPGFKDIDETVVNVLEVILGQGESSRLYNLLVEDKKVALSVSSFAYQLTNGGIFLVLIEPVEGKSEKCKHLVQEEIENIIKTGVTEKELNKVIYNQSREFFEKLQDLESLTYEWIKSYLVTKDEFEIFNKNKKFLNIKSKDIQNFAKEYLDSFFMNQMQLLPLPEDKKDIWEKTKKESEQFEKSILDKNVRTTPVEEPKYVYNLKEPENLDFSFPKPDYEFTLNNGMKVLLHQNSHWPIININLRFKNAEFWSQSKEGILLNLMMDMLLEGNKDYTKKESIDFFENLGVDYSFDVSGISISCLNDIYESVFERLFKIITAPIFPTKGVNKIKDICVDTYERGKDSPFEIAVRSLKNLIYKNHPYEWTFDQAIDLIKNSTVSDIKNLYKKYLIPNNMIMSVVGDFDISKMQEEIIELFDKWPAGKAPEIVSKKNDFIPENIDKFMLRDQVVLILGQPSDLTLDNPDLVPVKILNLIMFDSLGSRLFKYREQTGLFYTGFGLYSAGATKQPGFDYIGAILSLDKLDLAQEGILNTVKQLNSKGITLDELKAARQIYLKGIIDLTSSNDAVAIMLCRLQDFELGFDYYDNVLKRVQAISVEELNDIAKKYFTVDNMARVRVGRVGKK